MSGIEQGLKSRSGKWRGTSENDSHVTSAKIFKGMPQMLRLLIRRSLGCPAFAGKIPISHYFSPLLFEFGLNTRLLHPRPVLAKYLACQMIYFMLNTHGEQAIGFKCVKLSVPIQRLDRDPLGAWYFPEYSRYRQTTFFILGFAALRDDFWIDQHMQLVMRIGNVNHDCPQMHIDLGRRQSNSRRGIHCFRHILQQSANFMRNFRYRARDGMQPFIRILQYF